MTMMIKITMIKRSDNAAYFLINDWLEQERSLGAPNPRQAVLATVSSANTPHARVVALREINESGLLFFTQSGTRKVQELTKNSHAVFTFWLELQQREVIVEGVVEKLSVEENKQYWMSYSREAQIRFHAYAPTSSQVIFDKQALEIKKSTLTEAYANKAVPFSSHYCGFRLTPTRFIFYAYRTDELSDVFSFEWQDGWQKSILSP